MYINNYVFAPCYTSHTFNYIETWIQRWGGATLIYYFISSINSNLLHLRDEGPWIGFHHNSSEKKRSDYMRKLIGISVRYNLCLYLQVPKDLTQSQRVNIFQIYKYMLINNFKATISDQYLQINTFISIPLEQYLQINLSIIYEEKVKSIRLIIDYRLLMVWYVIMSR